MTKLAELNKEDFKEFVLDMIQAEGLDWAINRIYENSTLSESIAWRKTKRGYDYWSNIYFNGYAEAKVEMTMQEIEEKLNMKPNTLKILPF